MCFFCSSHLIDRSHKLATKKDNYIDTDPIYLRSLLQKIVFCKPAGLKKTDQMEMNATFWASLILYNFSKVDGSSSKVHIEDHFLIHIVPIKFLSSALTDLRVEISRQTHANTHTCIC